MVAEGSLYIEAGATEMINLDAAAKFAIVSFENAGSKTGVAIADGPAESLAMRAQFLLTSVPLQVCNPPSGNSGGESLKVKIWVYTIAKNERQFCERFMRSCAGADGVAVLDTGSTDGTAEKLRELGAAVAVSSVSPWRFDVARNMSLELVPEEADVCISLDLDEVLSEGWREAVEHAWSEGTRRGRYLYVWSHNGAEDGVTFYADKRRSRRGWTGKYPVHEVLSGEGESFLMPGLRVDHWPDDPKSRASYLPLLELAVSEDPANDRNMH